jgi:hypothetical protein
VEEEKKEINEKIKKFMDTYVDYMSKTINKALEDKEVDKDAIYALGDAVRVMHHIKKILFGYEEPLK